MFGEYGIHLLILIGIYLILAQSLNFTFGLGRLFNLAHIASYALGAYATALLSTEYGWGFFPCIVSSMLVSGGLALFLGGISLRLKQDYFAIGTLAFHSIVIAFLVNWKEVTRGMLGIPGIPRPQMYGYEFLSSESFLWLTYSLVAIVLFLLWIMNGGPYARALRGQAEADFACQTLGWNTIRVRNVSFLVSSSLAGLSGSLFAYYLNYIDPTSFSLKEVIFVLTIVVVGKPGSYWGVIAATCFLVLLPEPFRFSGEIESWCEALFALKSGSLRDFVLLGPLFGVLDWMNKPSVLGPFRQFLYGFVLFLVILWNREKIFPLQREV